MCHSQSLGRQSSGQVSHEVAHVPLTTGEAMPGMVFHPAGPPLGPILLVSDIYGMTPFYRDVGEELAEAGFATLVVDYFFRLGELEVLTREAARARRSGLDEVQALRDIDAAVNWLKARFGEPASPVGLIGFCLGGTLALDLAVERADLAVVSYYGLVAGVGGTTAAPAPLAVANRINGPILAFWGDEDHVVDMADVERFATASGRARGELRADNLSRHRPRLPLCARRRVEGRARTGPGILAAYARVLPAGARRATLFCVGGVLLMKPSVATARSELSVRSDCGVMPR